MDVFNLKPVKLSETVYSEILDSIREARAQKDAILYAEAHVEAFIVLEDAGIVDRNITLSVQAYENLLRHAHLDAQVQTPSNEKRKS